MGLSFFVGEIQEQTNVAVTLANEYIQDAGLLKDAMNAYLNAPLSGKTYDSARRYFMAVYPPLSNALILAAESLSEAHQKYPAKFQEIVGGGDIEEDRLRDQIQQGQSLLRSYANVMDKLEEQNLYLERCYMSVQGSIAKLEERLQKLYTFDSVSAGIFTEAEANIENLERAIAALNKGGAWNPASGTFDVTRLDMTWVKPIQEKWQEREQAIQEKLMKNLLDYELRPTQGPNGTVIYEVYVNGELDPEATLQYKTYLSLKKRQELLENPLTLEEKLLLATLFVGITFFIGGSLVTITGVTGIVDGVPILSLNTGGSVMMAQAIVNKEALAKVAEGFLITSAGVVSIMASGNMLGENGPRFESKTTWQKGRPKELMLKTHAQENGLVMFTIMNLIIQNGDTTLILENL
ncbi:T7SS effector LXG polymorphic toxin [Enterococcus sp. LJL51]|uniref:T7SS effector LXG polymorphic toxin n=1 Tax=Enterococcus sp. LJL51 TaxID=3416656 RepID=UPI003CF348F4